MVANPFRLDRPQGRDSRRGKKRNSIVGLQTIITDPLRGSTWGARKLSGTHGEGSTAPRRSASEPAGDPAKNGPPVGSA